MLERKIPWKVLKIFAQECSNDHLWLTWLFMASSLLLPCLLYGKVHGACKKLVQKLIDTVKQNEHINIFCNTGYDPIFNLYPMFLMSSNY